MPIHVKCPSCSSVLQLPDASAPGGMVRCPKCATVLRIPGQAPASPSKPPAPPVQKQPPKPAPPPIRKPSPPPVRATPSAVAKKPSSRPPSAPPVRQSKAIKPPSKAPSLKTVAEDPPASGKGKSKKRLLLGALGCAGLLFLACGGGISYGIYWLYNTGKTVQQKIETASQEIKENQAKQDALANNPPAANVLDLSFIHPDFNAAFVIQPARIVRSRSPLLPSQEERDRLVEQGIQASGIDLSKVGQIIVVLEPAPPGRPANRPGRMRPGPGARPPGPPARPGADESSPFIFAVIMHFTEPVDDLAIFDKPLHQSDRVQFSGKTYYRSKTEKQDGQPLAGHYDGNRTILLGPEPMLKKMLALKSTSTPLGEKLREFGLEHDLFGVFLAEPVRSMLKDLIQSPAMQTQFPTVKTLDTDLNVLRLTASLDGDRLMRIILEAKDDGAAKNLEDFAEALLNLAKAVYPQIKPIIQKGASPEAAASVLRVTDQFVKKEGITINREGKSVLITLNKPKDL